MKSRITIIFAAVLIAFASCDKMEQPILFNGDVGESQVVMQSRITSGDTIKVRLSYSRFFLDASPFRMIDNATFELKVNGSPVPAAAKYSTEDYLYSLGYVPAPNDVLDITVHVPGHESVTAHTVMPQIPSASNATVTYAGYNYESQLHQYVVNFRLNDPGNENNFYLISFNGSINEICTHREIHETRVYDTVYINDTFYIIGPHSVYDTVILSDTNKVNISPSFTCRDYLIADPQTDLVGGLGENYEYNEMFFDDSKINGMQHEVQLTVLLSGYYLNDYGYDIYEPYYGYSSCTYDTSTLNITMELTSYSRDLYLYEQTTNSIDSELGGIISEPVQIHCNINGGIGIFAGKTTVTIPISTEH
ncbi:MAG: DUF4249 domain-containing protein [Bacteroidales bacterium]|nr:DUF4249 domain-containing protein [Bacteroidales bacterium]